MAAKLDRTVSAINKILSRHNFRTTQRIDYSLNITYKSSSRMRMKKLPKRHDSSPQTLDSSQIIGSLPPDHRFWTPFIEVMRWLRQNNIPIIKSPMGAYYEVKGIPRSKEQVLCIANTMREEQCLPIFWVKGITKE
jgi:hypothetical protein